MKREIVYVKVKLVIEYDNKDDRKEAIAHAKEGLNSIRESCGGDSNWSYRPTRTTLIKATNVSN